MIDLKPEYLQEIIDILQKHVPECEIRVFGSRVNHTAQPYSDLDLALVGPQKIHWQRLEALKYAFSESNLPIMVDIIDWHALSGDFQKLIKENYEVLAIK